MLRQPAASPVDWLKNGIEIVAEDRWPIYADISIL